MDLICENCGTYLNFLDKECPLCSHANKYYTTNVSYTPQTIKELKDWYETQGFGPYESTRFFIGIDYKKPKAFGIFENSGVFTVYKNKRDGSRAIRYQGPDEAYAVNELYLKLKDELVDKKYNRKGDMSIMFYLQYFLIMAVAVPCSMMTKTAFPAVPILITLIYGAAILDSKLSALKKMSLKAKILMGVGLFLILSFGLVKYNMRNYTPRYYNYQNMIICAFKGDYFLYEESKNDYVKVKTDSVPKVIKKDDKAYRLDTASKDYKSEYSFKESNLYNTYIKNSSSSDSYHDNYNYSDTSDSSSTDWDSDW